MFVLCSFHSISSEILFSTYIATFVFPYKLTHQPTIARVYHTRVVISHFHNKIHSLNICVFSIINTLFIVIIHQNTKNITIINESFALILNKFFINSLLFCPKIMKKTFMFIINNIYQLIPRSL